MNFGSLYRLLNLISYYLLLNKLCETDTSACFTSLRLILVLEKTRSALEMKLVDCLLCMPMYKSVPSQHPSRHVPAILVLRE